MSTNDNLVFSFKTGSALLSELGERLVAEPGIAFTELIKNAHDADASFCKVIIEEDKIVILDDGHGMSKDEFDQKWMTIATDNKLHNKTSRIYKRIVTGAKGVGRFSARFLGKNLKVETIAYDEALEKYTQINIEFDWIELDKYSQVSDMKIEYTLKEYDNATPGTKLIISNLKHLKNTLNTKEIYTEILKLTSPFQVLLPPKKNINSLQKKPKGDPGFDVQIENSDQAKSENPKVNTLDIASLVLSNYIGRAIVIVNKNELTITIKLKDNKKVHHKTYKIQGTLGTDVYADIRFFPRRKGRFSNIKVSGHEAANWIQENSGVSVFDHYFKMKPYGDKDDDWLHLDIDNAHSVRHWRSSMMNQYFPMNEAERKKPKINPMLNLPASHQLVGAVYVQSNKGGDSQNYLMPAMDRSGFVNNQGYALLTEVIRFAIELLTKFDKDDILEKEQIEIEKIRSQAKEDIKEVIKHIEASASLSIADKNRLISTYVHLEENIDEIDAYNRESRESLEIMSLLGAVAGFMTHEYQSTLFELQQAIDTVKGLTAQHPELLSVLKNLEKSLEYFTGYIEYTTFFIRNIRQDTTMIKDIKVLPRIKYVLNTFKQFREERNIKVKYQDINKDLYAPAIPVAMYDGIIHNLYSNALKALLSYDTNHKQQKEIKIIVWNEKEKHFIQVMDNGPGIPKEVQERIWDPLYTTTSSENNPLGSGMGIGLPMVKRVIESQKGKIELIKAPEGFNTCFRVTLPYKRK